MSIRRGSADPSGEAPTTGLDAVTEHIHLPYEPDSRPPARPRFEFRPPPSAVPAPRPRTLTRSSLLWMAAAGMLLLAVVLPLIGVGDLWAEVTALVNRDFPNEQPAARDRVAALVALLLVGGGVLLAVLVAGAAAAMRRGRSFARVLLALVFALVVVHALLMIGVAPAPSVVLVVAGLALGLAAGVLMFLPTAADWLARPRRG